jgi:uncharacterized oligopeptide transporter (OPT) family protein
MLFLGVIAASLVIPLFMHILFEVYGIAGVYPHAGMSQSKMLVAPVPSVLAMVTMAVFNGQLPLNMLLVGVGIIIGFIVLNFALRFTPIRLSILGVGMGIYLPFTSTTALFIGSIFAFITQKRLKHHSQQGNGHATKTALACGLLAGSALMDVVLAIPFALSGNPNIFNILPDHFQGFAVMLAIFSLAGLTKIFCSQLKTE